MPSVPSVCYNPFVGAIKRIHVTLDIELWKRALEAAGLMGLSLSAYIRVALLRMLNGE